ncbi:MAG: hypothetical protein OEV52_04315 [Dehalococcoidia bacterium]|nr:hypothetical protein [Dehalococcoidia bacterium]
MTFKLMPNINKRLEQIARDGGRAGTAHFDFKVAHKGGEPCPVCGCVIERVPVQNRGSYFCPRCQPL